MPRRSSKAAAPARKRPGTSRDHDFATVARNVVEQAIGERLTGEHLTDPNAGKDPAAVSMGKRGGPKGGRARAKALTKERRIAIAKKAAATRWGKAR